MPVLRDVLLVGGDYQARDKLSVKLEDMGFRVANWWPAQTHTKARDVPALPTGTELVIALPYYGNPELTSRSKELAKTEKVPWVAGHPVDWLALKARIDALPTLNRALTHRLPLPKPVELDPAADRVWFCDACGDTAELVGLTGTEVCKVTDTSLHLWRAVSRKDLPKIAQATVPAPKPPPAPVAAAKQTIQVKPAAAAATPAAAPAEVQAPAPVSENMAALVAKTLQQQDTKAPTPYTPAFEVAPAPLPPENPLVLPVALTKAPVARPDAVPVRTMANGAKSPGPVRVMEKDAKTERGQFLIDWILKNPDAATFHGAYEAFKIRFGHGIAGKGLHWYMEAVTQKSIPLGTNLVLTAKKYVHEHQLDKPVQSVATPPVVPEVSVATPTSSTAPKFVPPVASPDEGKVPDDVVAAVKLLTEALKGKRQIAGYIAFNFENGEVTVSNEIEILVRKTIKAQL